MPLDDINKLCRRTVSKNRTNLMKTLVNAATSLISRRSIAPCLFVKHSYLILGKYFLLERIIQIKRAALLKQLFFCNEILASTGVII